MLRIPSPGGPRWPFIWHRVCAALLLVLALVSPGACTPTVVPEAASLPRNLTICFQITSDGRDSGFSMNNIVAARKADERIRALYSVDRSRFRTKTILNQSVAFVANHTANLIGLIEDKGCNVIVSTGPRMWGGLKNSSIDELSGMYPSVQFMLYTDYAPTVTHPNAHFVFTDSTRVYFAAGAAAAVACTSCIGFMSMASTYGLGTTFHRGMQFGQQFRGDGANVTALCPLLVFSIPDRNLAESEVAFARAMHARGCSIVVSGVKGARVIQQERFTTPAGRPMFSIAVGTDGALLIGDTVLTSMNVYFENSFVHFLASLLTQTPFVSGINRNDDAKLDTISPLAQLNVSVAVHAAEMAYASSNGSTVWCTPIYTPEGALFNPVVNGTVQCVPPEAYQLLPFVEHGLAQFPPMHPPSTCPAGTYAQYSALTDMSLTCVPCPDGTYAAARGQLVCTACPAGAIALLDRTKCTPVARSSDPASRTLTVVLLAVLVPCVCAAACILAWAIIRRWRGDCVPPPRGPAIALALFQVDEKRSSKNWRKQILEGAYVFELLRHSVHAAAAKHNVYICLASPSAYVVAADTPEQLVELAEDVEQALVTHSDAFSTCFISITAAVVVGSAYSRPNEALEGKVEYIGPAVLSLLALKTTMTLGGGLWLRTPLFDQLVQSDPSLKLRRIRAARSSRDGPEQAIAVRFRFIPAPGQREQVEAAAERGLAMSSSSLVVQRGQKETLRAIFQTIASRFLFAAPAKDQRKVAQILANRFRIFLVPHPAATAAVAAPVAGSPHRNDELRHMILLVTPYVLDLMDEMSVREHIQALGPTHTGLAAPSHQASAGDVTAGRRGE